ITCNTMKFNSHSSRGSKIQGSQPYWLQRKGKVKLSESARKQTTTFIARMIAVDLQPYEFVENKGFQDFIHYLQPQYKVPRRTIFSRTVIPELYQNT
ncbi:hypothetical protein IscW_ISCW008607, partial [Ixodes scapularis]